MDLMRPQVSGEDLILGTYGRAVDPVRDSHRVESRGPGSMIRCMPINICLQSVTESLSVRFLQAGPLSTSQFTYEHAVACLWSMTTQ